MRAILLAPDQSCTPCCFADFDCSGSVGAADLLTLLASWGPCAGCPADLDCDCDVGASDLLILLGEWGECGGSGSSEPPQDILDCITRFCCDEEDILALEKCLCAVDPECDPSP